MEPEPKMEARPPALADAIVRALIPPACREAVIGDLWERYRSPARYLADALQALPFLVLSRIRRTTNVPMAGTAFLMLFAAFQRVTQPWLSGVFPALAVLVAFVLRDAYRDVTQTRLRRAMGDGVVIAVSAFASQLILAGVRPELMLTSLSAMLGASLCVLLLFMRYATPQIDLNQALAASGAALSLDELRREIEYVQRSARATRRIETGASVLVIAGSLAGVWFAPEPLVRLGLGLIAAGALFVVTYMHRHAMRPIPMDVGFSQTRSAFRGELVYGEWLLRRVWLWYLMPLMLGPAVLLIGWVSLRQRPLVAVAVLFAGMTVMTILVHRMNRAAADRLARRIETLDKSDERE